jgi:hypothetical protein
MPAALADKVLLITGGASGIGLATALLAARSEAAGIVLADRDSDALAAAEDALRAEGCKVEALAVDVTSPDGPDAVMNINVRGVFRCMRAQLRQMYRQRSGSIVNIASASVFGVHPGLGAYVTSEGRGPCTVEGRREGGGSAGRPGRTARRLPPAWAWWWTGAAPAERETKGAARISEADPGRPVMTFSSGRIAPAG